MVVIKVMTSCKIDSAGIMLERQEERGMRREGIHTTGEHSSPLGSNCHQREVFGDVNI